MASFTEEEIDRQDLDWEILRDGGVALYLRLDLLLTDLEWLRSRGYEVKEIESGSWSSEASMHDAVASTLHFPTYYGRNLDALDECLSDDVVVPQSGGLAIVFKGFDKFAAVSNRAETTVGIFARASRHHMLTGRRFIVLIQSSDPKIRFDALAAVSAHWNRKEWLMRDRGL